MGSIEEMEIKNIDHLGIVAGIVDSIGLIEIINDYCGKLPDEKVSSGHVVKAMILNGLGFVSSPLYMFSEFFKDKPCEYLIGEGVKAEYLNDDKLGRVMDKLFLKGLTEIFLAISMNVKKQFDISSKSSHLDSSSLHVHGEYNNSLPDVIIDIRDLQVINCPTVSQNFRAKPRRVVVSLDRATPTVGQFIFWIFLSPENLIKASQAIEITYGYSRDHRPDLKQFIIELISSGDGDIPMFFEAASGNKSDSSSFPKIFSKYKEKIKDNDDLMVADAALYNAKNINLLSGMKWLCRVPLTIGRAKELVSTLLTSDFIPSSLLGYYYCSRKVNYGGIEQRWLIVESSERKKSDLRQLEKRISSSRISASNQLKKLIRDLQVINCPTVSQNFRAKPRRVVVSLYRATPTVGQFIFWIFLNSKFKSQQEAISIVDNLNKKLKYHQIDNVEYLETVGKSKKDPIYFYQVNASLSENINAIKIAYNKAGRFVLATNVLDEKYLGNDAGQTHLKLS